MTHPGSTSTTESASGGMLKAPRVLCSLLSLKTRTVLPGIEHFIKESRQKISGLKKDLCGHETLIFF